MAEEAALRAGVAMFAEGRNEREVALKTTPSKTRQTHSRQYLASRNIQNCGYQHRHLVNVGRDLPRVEKTISPRGSGRRCGAVAAAAAAAAAVVVVVVVVAVEFKLERNGCLLQVFRPGSCHMSPTALESWSNVSATGQTMWAA